MPLIAGDSRTPCIGVDMIDEFDTERESLKRDFVFSGEHLHSSDALTAFLASIDDVKCDEV